MRHDPADPHWVGRDRFVLSCGHSSLTLYIQLYLAGFGLELGDLEALRTWGSLTPGHPEYHHTKGVEITTGPLGQGLASAVGMAMASRRERGLFDPDAAPGESPFDHFIYVVCSDGDLEEGVTSEASSIAGRQELGNLIVFYDHNEISIEDDTNIAFAEDVPMRYESYGWHVQTVEGGENVVGIQEAIEKAKAVTDKPSFIQIRTIIGYPAPNLQNTGKAHGAALGNAEVAAVKKILGFDPDRSFQVDDVVIKHTRQALDRGQEAKAAWQPGFDAWAAANPERKRTVRPVAGPGSARRLGRCAAVLAGGRQGGGDPGRVRKGAERAGGRAARTLGRFGRPGRVEQHHDGGRRLVRAGRREDQTLERAPPTGGPCTSASASTRWARS